MSKKGLYAFCMSELCRLPSWDFSPGTFHHFPFFHLLFSFNFFSSFFPFPLRFKLFFFLHKKKSWLAFFFFLSSATKIFSGVSSQEKFIFTRFSFLFFFSPHCLPSPGKLFSNTCINKGCIKLDQIKTWHLFDIVKCFLFPCR